MKLCTHLSITQKVMLTSLAVLLCGTAHADRKDICERPETWTFSYPPAGCDDPRTPYSFNVLYEEGGEKKTVTIKKHAQLDISGYAKKEELGKTKSAIEHLSGTVGTLNTDLSGMKRQAINRDQELSKVKNQVNQLDEGMGGLNQRVTHVEQGITLIDSKGKSQLVKPGDTLNFATDKSLSIENKDGQLFFGLAKDFNMANIKTDVVESSQKADLANGVLRLDAPTKEKKNSTLTLKSNTQTHFGGNTLSHIGDGKADDDAVSLRQLKSWNEKVSSENLAKQYHYEQRLSDLSKRFNRGISAALATASLPSASQSGESAFGMGVASYDGQVGFAMGISHATENGRWIFKGALTAGNRVGISAGTAYRW